MKALSDFDLGWLVGALEGEGCFTISSRKPNGGRTWRFGVACVQVRMSDKDVVTRLHDTTGIGNLRPGTRGPAMPTHWKDTWHWQVSTASEISALLVSILPHLGERRAERAWELLDNIGKRQEMAALARGI